MTTEYINEEGEATIPFSEALLLGIPKIKKGLNSYFSINGFCACAGGTAMVGLGLDSTTYTPLSELWPKIPYGIITKEVFEKNDSTNDDNRPEIAANMKALNY